VLQAAVRLGTWDVTSTAKTYAECLVSCDNCYFRQNASTSFIGLIVPHRY
jgi:hypothetical protein